MAKGYTDTDKGMKDILAEMEKMKSMCVKVGVTEDVAEKPHGDADGPTLLEIATWNEYGTADGRIPARPFIRGFADSKREEIANIQAGLMKLVTSGKMTAEEAIEELGRYGMEGVQKYMETGSFAPNSHVTIHGSKPDKKGNQFIKGKGSSRPLINEGTLQGAIGYKVINEPVGAVGSI